MLYALCFVFTTPTTQVFQVEAVSIWGYAQFVWIPVSVRFHSITIGFPLNSNFPDTLCHVTYFTLFPGDFDSFPCLHRPVNILRWSLVALAFGLSGYFLFRNIYPILASVSTLLPSDDLV